MTKSLIEHFDIFGPGSEYLSAMNELGLGVAIKAFVPPASAVLGIKGAVGFVHGFNPAVRSGQVDRRFRHSTRPGRAVFTINHFH